MYTSKRMIKFRSRGNKIQNCHGEATSQPQQQKLVHSKIRINQNNSGIHNENYTKRREDKSIKKELYVDRESQLLTNSNSASILFTLIQASDSSSVVKNSPFFRALVVLPPSFLQNLFVSLKQGSPQGSFFSTSDLMLRFHLFLFLFWKIRKHESCSLFSQLFLDTMIDLIRVLYQKICSKYRRVFQEFQEFQEFRERKVSFVSSNESFN